MIGEEAVQEHLEVIFRSMGKILRNDENAYVEEISHTCRIIGCFIECEVYLPIMMKMSSEEELRTQPRLLSSYLLMMSNLIWFESDALMSTQLGQVVNFLVGVEQSMGENYEVMASVLEIVVQLVRVCHQNIPIYARQLFSLVLSVQAFSVEDSQEQVTVTLNKLASACGYSSLSELHTNEVNVMVEEIVQSRGYEHWKKGGRELNKFQAIVRGCSEGIAKFMEQVIQIMKHCLQVNQEIELRMEMLILLEYILKLQSLSSVLKLYSTQIMTVSHSPHHL